ncbi:MAG: hypothetical protein HFP77_07340 [Methylococcales symbiont of Iophon sp. n. MRB-2018]|nr:MAG: hypothetical protein HFP77_07340 [Methylococcales symbiont of Iophon sp. n. MRB-2018]KAF3979645.1 MAG: hypothetical protein HFP76_06410 [Methylococcales symbiont of Iophon sp. n. MRB-2018]
MTTEPKIENPEDTADFAINDDIETLKNDGVKNNNSAEESRDSSDTAQSTDAIQTEKQQLKLTIEKPSAEKDELEKIPCFIQTNRKIKIRARFFENS